MTLAVRNFLLDTQLQRETNDDLMIWTAPVGGVHLFKYFSHLCNEVLCPQAWLWAKADFAMEEAALQFKTSDY